MKPVYEGLLIIGQYDPHSDFYAAHEQIWFGDYQKTFEQMTDKEFERLKELGWFEDEDSWSVQT